MAGVGPGRQIDAYCVDVKVSKNQVIMVEGIRDKQIFVRLITELKQQDKIPQNVVIDTAEQIGSPPGQIMGNREKVEAVCDALAGKPEASRFVGFVDREFRGFQLSESVSDEISSHYLSGRLLWSRGHSIENYFLDYSLFSHAIGNLSSSTHCFEALSVLEPLFPSMLRLACAIGLTAKEHRRLGAIRDKLRWKGIYLESEAKLDQVFWAEQLGQEHGWMQQEIQAMFDSIRSWLANLNNCDNETVRWLCDGHLGLAVALATFQRAVYEVTRRDSGAADNAVTFKREHYLQTCAYEWAKQACLGQAIWPEELVNLLSPI